MVSELNRWFINGSVEDIDFENDILESRKRKLIYYFEGDTLIGGMQYMKMYAKQMGSIFHQSYSNQMDVPNF